MENENGRTGQDSSIHLSDCAVRYEPAYPNAACNCGAESVAAKHYYKQVMTLLAEVERLETNYCENVNFVCRQRAAARRIVEEYRTGRRYGDGVAFDDAVKFVGELMREAAELPPPEKKPNCRECADWGSCPYHEWERNPNKEPGCFRTKPLDLERRIIRLEGKAEDAREKHGAVDRCVVYISELQQRCSELEATMKLLRRLGVSYEKYRRVISAGVLSNEELAALESS